MWILVGVLVLLLIVSGYWNVIELKKQREKYVDEVRKIKRDMENWKIGFMQEEFYNYQADNPHIRMYVPESHSDSEIGDVQAEIVPFNEAAEQQIFRHTFSITNKFMGMAKAGKMKEIKEFMIRDAKIKIALKLPFSIIKYPDENDMKWHYVLKLIALNYKGYRTPNVDEIPEFNENDYTK